MSQEGDNDPLWFLPFRYPTGSEGLDRVEQIELHGIARPTHSQYHCNRRLGGCYFNRLAHFLDKPAEMSHQIYFTLRNAEFEQATGVNQ